MEKKLFRFAKSRALTLPSGRSVRAPSEKLKKEEDQPPFYIRGIKAGSKDEYWVSLELELIEAQTGWTWDYQVPVYGGRDIAGGNVIDFLVHTPGMWTLLDPMGKYWHTGKNEDQSQMQEVARRKHYRLVAWFTDKTPTREILRSFLRHQLFV